MSMRHLQIDRVVDMAWFRNREVARWPGLGEADEFCFSYSLDQLRSLAALSQRLHQPIELHVYHTGFEPASMGFYRALVAVFLGDEAFDAAWAKGLAPWLVAIPYYFKGGARYEPSQDASGNRIEWF